MLEGCCVFNGCVKSEKGVLVVCWVCVLCVECELRCECCVVMDRLLVSRLGGAIGFGQVIGGRAVNGGGRVVRPLTRARRSRRGTYVDGRSGWCRPLVANASAPTLPRMPACAFIHSTRIVLLSFLILAMRAQICFHRSA